MDRKSLTYTTIVTDRAHGSTCTRPSNMLTVALQVSRVWINNYTPIYIVGCSDLNIPTVTSTQTPCFFLESIHSDPINHDNPRLKHVGRSLIHPLFVEPSANMNCIFCTLLKPLDWNHSTRPQTKPQQYRNWAVYMVYSGYNRVCRPGAPSFSQAPATHSKHDDVIKWKHFPRYWSFVRGIHRSPVNSLHKGQWRGASMFSLICARINVSVNNREAGDLWRYRAHYDVIVMRSGTCRRKLQVQMSCTKCYI